MPGSSAGPGFGVGPGLRLPPRTSERSTDRRYWVGPRLCGTSQTGYGPGGLRLCNTGTSYASTADNALLRPTGDMEMVVKLTAVDWTPGTSGIIANNGSSVPGSNMNYSLVLGTTGLLAFTRPTGATVRTYTSTVSVDAVDRRSKWIKVEFDQNNGSAQSQVNFYTSDDGTTWVALGAAVTNASTGAGNVGTSGMYWGRDASGSAPWAGNIHRVTVRDGIAGTVVYDADFDAATPDAASFVESSANAFTVTVTTAAVIWNRVAAWSSTSNGIAGASIPTTTNDVVFDQGSGRAPSSLTTNHNIRSLNTTAWKPSGNGIAESSGITLGIGDAYGGAFLLGAGTWVAQPNATITFLATGGQDCQILGNGNTLGALTFGGSARWRLIGPLISGNAITHSNTGSLSLDGHAVTATSMGNTAGTLYLTSSLITLSGNSGAWSTTGSGRIDGGTSTIQYTGNSTASLTLTQTANATNWFNNIEFPNGSPVSMTGTINCRNLTYRGGARTTDSVGASTSTTTLNVSGTLTIDGRPPPQRIIVAGQLGAPFVITAATFVSNGYVDWRDVTAAGAAAPFVPTTMTPSLRSVARATGNGSVDPGFPSGAADDDLLFATVSCNGAVPTITPPSGWTLIASTPSGGGLTHTVNYYWAKKSAITTTAWSIAVTNTVAISVFAYQNAVIGTPSVAGAGGTATTSAVSAASVPSASNYLDVLIVSMATAGITQTAVPAGFTENYDSGTGTANEAAESDVMRSDGTATASVTATMSGSTNLVSLRVVVPGNGLFGDGGGNTNVTFPVSQTNYLCAASPTWSRTTAWSTTAGGTPGSGRVPLPHDDVLMGTGGNAVTGTITSDCSRWGRDIDFTGFAPTVGGLTVTASLVGIYGSVTLVDGIGLNVQVSYEFWTRSTATITSNGMYWSGQVVGGTNTISWNGPGGEFIFADDFYSGLQTATLNAGRLVLGANTVTFPTFTEATSTNLAKGIDYDTGSLRCIIANTSLFAFNSGGNLTDTSDPGGRLTVARPEGGVYGGAFVATRYNAGTYENWWRTNWQSSLDATTELDVRVRIELNNPTPVASGTQLWSPFNTATTLASRFLANLQSWSFRIDTTGTLTLVLSSTGANNSSAASSATLQSVYGSAPQTKWLRATWRSSDGRVQYLVADGALTNPSGGDWVQLGTNQTVFSGTPIFSSPSPIEVLGLNAAAAATAFRSADGGKLHYFDLRTTIDGSPVAVLDFSGVANYSMSLADGLGNEWWQRPSASSAPTVARVLGRRLQIGGGVNYAATADTAVLDATTQLDLRAKVSPNAWVQGSNQTIIAKRATTGNQNSYALQIQSTGGVILSISTDGITNQNVASTVTLPAAIGITAWQTKWIRATWRSSDGRTQFFYSDDGVAWTQLGADVIFVSGGTIFNSTAVLSVGCEAAGTNFPTTGQIWYADLRTTIDGTPVAVFDPSTLEDLARSWTDSTGKVWTVTSSATPTVQGITWDLADTLSIPNLTIDIEPGGLHGVITAQTGSVVVGAIKCLGPKEPIQFGTAMTVTADDWTFTGGYVPGGRTPRTRLRSITNGTKSARQNIVVSDNITYVDIQDVWIRGPYETFSGLGSTPPSPGGTGIWGPWADDPAYVNPGNGNAAPDARDYVGAGARNLTQATPANRPIFRTNQIGTGSAWVFDASNDYLVTSAGVTTSPQPLTMLMVARFANTGGAASRFITAQLSTFGVFRTSAGVVNVQAGTIVAGGTITTSPTLIATVMSTTVGRVQQDGTRTSSAVNTGASVPANNSAIGGTNTGTNPWDGDIALVFWYSGDLLTGDPEAYYNFVKWVSSFYTFSVVDLVDARGSVNNGNNEGWRFIPGWQPGVYTVAV